MGGAPWGIEHIRCTSHGAWVLCLTMTCVIYAVDNVPAPFPVPVVPLLAWAPGVGL